MALCYTKKHKKFITLDEFLTRSKLIHNHFYNYDKVDFTDKTAKQKVIITCPIHR